MCFAISFSLRVFYEINFENAMLIGQLSIIVVLYLFYTVNLLKLGAIFIMGIIFVAAMLAVVISYRRNNIIKHIKKICQVPFWSYVIYIVIVYFLVKDLVPYWGDELRYWAAMPKVLYQFDAVLQLKSGFQVYCVDYFPGTSIYCYFLEFINGRWDDGILFFGYAALSGALILPVSKNIKKCYGAIVIIVLMYFVPLYFYNTPNNDCEVFYQGLYVDALVGVSAGVLSWLMLKKPWERIFDFIQFILVACFMILLKSSGISFVIVITIAMLIYLGFYQREVLIKYWFWLLWILPYFLYILWKILIRYYGVKVAIDYKVSSFIDLGFISTFANALYNEQILETFYTPISKYCTFITCFILIIGLMLYLYNVQTNHNASYKENNYHFWVKFTYISVIVQIVLFVIGLYGLYVGAFNYTLVSFPRYICTVLEMSMSFCILVLIDEWNFVCETIKKSKVMRNFGIIIASLCLLIAPLKHVNNYDTKDYPQYIYNDYESIIDVFRVVQNPKYREWNNIVVLYDEPDYEDESMIQWSKRLYGHLFNNISYYCIDKNIRLCGPYYSSQVDISIISDKLFECSLRGSSNCDDIDYVLMVHGEYVDKPVYAWELCEIDKRYKSNKLLLNVVASENKNVAK